MNDATELDNLSFLAYKLKILNHEDQWSLNSMFWQSLPDENEDFILDEDSSDEIKIKTDKSWDKWQNEQYTLYLASKLRIIDDE